MNRWLWLLALFVIAMVGGLVWQLTSSSKPSTARPMAIDASMSERPADAVPTRVVNVPTPRRDAAATGEGEELPDFDPKSDEFNHKIDVVIGDKFRAVGAANCDESGIDPDGIVRVTYTLRIRDKRVSATNIKATGERGAEALARCIEDSMQNAAFALPQMPDFEDDDADLFIRVKTLRKYRSRTEFDD